MDETLICDYCKGSYDKYFWHIPLNKLGTRLHKGFCTPECMLGYNNYMQTSTFEQKDRDERLYYIQCRYANYIKRVITPAPPYIVARRTQREVWLPRLRTGVKQELLDWEMSLSFNPSKITK